MNKMKLYVMAVLAMIVAGCSGSDEEALKPQVSLKDTPIQVNVLLADIQTRAGYEGTNLPEMFYLRIDQPGENYDYNVVMKHEGTEWLSYTSADADAPRIEMLWEGSTSTVAVTAATFPLTTTPYMPNALADQSTGEGIKASDHLYYHSDAVKASGEGISVTFAHFLSKLQIKITLGSEYEAETANPITAVTVLGTKLGATYTPGATPAWSTPTGGADIISCPATAYSNLTATYEVILEPQTVAADSFAVRIQIGNKLYEWTSATAVTLESGKQYTLALKAGKDKVGGNSFTATEWGSGDDQDMQTE